MSSAGSTLGEYGTTEHIRDEMIWLEAGLRTLLDISGDDPLNDPLAAYKGMMIDRNELLEADPSENEQAVRAWQAYSAFRKETEERIRGRAQLQSELPLLRLAAAFRLTVWEYRCVLMCLAMELDRKFEKWYAYLNDDATARHATVNLALRLLGDGAEDWRLGRGMLEPEGKLRRWLLQPVDGGAASPGLRSPLSLDHRVVSFLLDTEPLDGRLANFVEARELGDAPAPAWEGLAEVEGAAWRVVDEWPQESLPVIGLWGARGSGKRELWHRIAARGGRRLLVVSLAALPQGEEQLRGVLSGIVREALLTDAVIALAESDNAWKERLPRDLLMSALQDYAAHVREPLVGWLSTERRAIGELPLPEQAAYWSAELPLPAAADRALLWRRHAAELWQQRTAERGGEAAIKQKDDGSMEALGHEAMAQAQASDFPDYAALGAELSEQFHLTPGQISSAWKQAVVHANGRGAAWPGKADMAKAARGQFRHRLAQHAVAIEPRRSWADLILPEESKTLLQEACSRYILREKVFGEWGFGSKLSYGTGAHMLFAGPPGTGKTMAAEVAAGELGLELYRVDLSRIVSKYIGETEQRLRELFEEARQSSAILFFDEGDALFGKRTEVKDAHDRYANMEAAYLLQLIEAYDGVTILATNLMQNLDEALLRRMSSIVKFPFPSAEDRARIFESLLPAGAPRDEDLDIPFLAQRVDLSGGHIKNIVLAAAFLAAAEQRPIGMKHMVRAARAELQKLGQIPMRSMFAPYSD